MELDFLVSSSRHTDLGTSASTKDDKAWKRELEEQMYKNNKVSAINYGQDQGSVTSNNTNTRELPVKAMDLAKAKTTVAAAQKGENYLAPTKSNNIATKPLINTTKALSAEMNISTAYKSIDVTASTSKQPNTKVQELSVGQRKIWPYDGRAVAVTLLPDGEVVVRNYLSPSANIRNIDALVKTMKQFLGGDMQSMKINGELVWAAQETATPSAQPAHTHDYHVNIVY